MYVGLGVKCLLFLCGQTNIGKCRKNVVRNSCMEFILNLCAGSRAFLYGQTDRQEDVTGQEVTLSQLQ